MAVASSTVNVRKSRLRMRSIVAAHHRPALIWGFYSMKGLGAFELDPGWDASS